MGPFDDEFIVGTTQFDELPNITETIEEDFKLNNTPTIDGCTLISTVDPKPFQQLLKVLTLFTLKDVINIENSVVYQTDVTGNCLIFINLSKILTNITFDIISPKKYIPLMKQLSILNKIYIFTNDTTKQIIVTDGMIRIIMNQPSKTQQNNINIELSEFETLYQREISKESRAKIIKLSKETKGTIELLIHENNIKGINVPETAVYIFPDFVNDNISTKLDENTANIVLKIDHFLPFDGDQYKITIMKKEDKYICISNLTTIDKLIDIQIIERATNTTNNLSLFI